MSQLEVLLGLERPYVEHIVDTPEQVLDFLHSRTSYQVLFWRFGNHVLFMDWHQGNYFTYAYPSGYIETTHAIDTRDEVDYPYRVDDDCVSFTQVQEILDYFAEIGEP